MQDYLDLKLIHRLLRPIERPGVINTDMGWKIVRRAQQFTNRLPLLAHLTQRWHPKIGFHGDQIPIVYAQPQPQETPITRSISAELSQSSSPQRMVVQAKFAPGSDHANKLVQNTNYLAAETPPQQNFLKANTRTENFPSNQTTNAVGGVEATKSNKTNLLGAFNKGFAIAQPKLQSLSLNGERTNPRMIVQAKFATGNERSLSPPKQTPTTTTLSIEKPLPEQSLNVNSRNLYLETKAIDIDGQSEDLSGDKIKKLMPTVRLLLQPLPASEHRISPGKTLPIFAESLENALAFDTSSALPHSFQKKLQDPQSKIPNLIGLSQLETPLVFLNPRVNTESMQTELKVPNPGTTGIWKTEPMSKTTELLREVFPNKQSHETFNLQSDRQEKAHVQTPLDLEALTDKIERKIMQRLIVESERRGRNRWS